jgi:hypothetical protein
MADLPGTITSAPSHRIQQFGHGAEHGVVVSPTVGASLQTWQCFSSAAAIQHADLEQRQDVGCRRQCWRYGMADKEQIREHKCDAPDDVMAVRTLLCSATTSMKSLSEDGPSVLQSNAGRT